MEDLNSSFDERLEEVEVYIKFLRNLEIAAQSGPPKFDGSHDPITSQQQKILYSSVYLQLYNLVESTMTLCVESVAVAATSSNQWKVGDLCDSLKREWIRATARTHVDLTPENRLTCAIELSQILINNSPISRFTIEKGGGGNWDDESIELISQRIGFQLRVSSPVYSDIKRRIKNDMGPLALVRDLRNQLAHGSISFTECAEDVTVAQLTDIKEKTVNYLREVIACFKKFLTNFEFLIENKRPTIT